MTGSNFLVLGETVDLIHRNTKCKEIREFHTVHVITTKDGVFASCLTYGVVT